MLLRPIPIATAGLLVLMLMPAVAQAQQTIFNVPSADVTPKNQIYTETESQFRFFNPHAYYAGTEYGALGIGHNTEIDTTLYSLSNPHSDNISLGLGFRSVVPLFPKHLPTEELKYIVGAQAIPSLEGHGVGEWVYNSLSFRVPKTKTRLTAGISEGTHQLFGRNSVQFIGGVEQPVTKNLALISDWFSGTQALGYWTTGIAYGLPKAFTIYAGYQIPNDSRVGRSGFTFELARLFTIR